MTDPTATALWEAEQRRVARVPDPFVPPPATATAANPSLEAPGANLDALAALLLGLVGGLVGGAAALIGWTISTRRPTPDGCRHLSRDRRCAPGGGAGRRPVG